jgi:hypothetical protein
MELTFVNVLLLVALAVVCFLLGFREGGRHGYAIGHADGIFAGEKGIKELLTESELKAVEERWEEKKREFLKRLKEHGVIK